MKELQVFQNSEFGELGILEIEGKIYFPATTCAKILGYTKPHNAISRHCRYSLKQGVPHPQNKDKVVEINFIPEGDLYRLIVSSKLPSAEKFECWVFDEVLPSIRKTGGYQKQTVTMNEIQDIITQTATIVATTIIKELVPVIQNIISDLVEQKKEQNCDRLVTQDEEPVAKPDLQYDLLLQQKQRLKVERFPIEFQNDLNDIFYEMQAMEAVNYSAVSRYCYAKGFPISGVALARYYNRYFRD